MHPPVLPRREAEAVRGPPREGMAEPGGPGPFTFWAELMVKSLFQDPGWAPGGGGGRWIQLECTQDPRQGKSPKQEASATS